MHLAEHLLSPRRSPMLHKATYDQELNAVTRGKSVWAAFAALAAALLALQLFAHTAPLGAAHEQEMTASQGEALVCDDSHVPEETSEHFLTRDRHRAGEHASGDPARSAAVMDAVTVAASSASSPPRHALRPSRPATDLSPAAVQVFRC